MKKTKKEVAVDRLYKAVAEYVNVNGGNALVAGGIQIQRWPGEPNYNYMVAVKITGRPPEFVEANKKGADPSANALYG